jgi:hypothetical protein
MPQTGRLVVRVHSREPIGPLGYQLRYLAAEHVGQRVQLVNGEAVDAAHLPRHLSLRQPQTLG